MPALCVLPLALHDRFVDTDDGRACCNGREESEDHSCACCFFCFSRQAGSCLVVAAVVVTVGAAVVVTVLVPSRSMARLWPVQWVYHSIRNTTRPPHQLLLVLQSTCLQTGFPVNPTSFALVRITKIVASVYWLKACLPLMAYHRRHSLAGSAV